MKPSVFERRAEMYRVQVVIPSHESEDELGISDEEYERQAELGLVDSGRRDRYVSSIPVCSTFRLHVVLCTVLS